MGAPKQKWTAEEEAALKAGVLKHGAGKWRTILQDPEFSSILHMRSNVDLKVSFSKSDVVILKSNYYREEVLHSILLGWFHFLMDKVSVCSKFLT